MKHLITWREACPKTGVLIKRTEPIEADSQTAALRFVEYTYYWETYPKVIKPHVGELQPSLFEETL